MDSKLKSLSETLANISIGYPLNHASNIVILLPFSQHLADTVQQTGMFSLQTQLTLGLMGLAYTIISVARQYVFRRLFERLGEEVNMITLFRMLYNRIRYGYAK